VDSELRIGGWSNDSNYDFHGLIDEVRVYENTLTTAQVINIMEERHSCTDTGLHHFEIQHDGTGLTCEAETLTLKACSNASCSSLNTESITLDVLGNGIVIGSKTFTGSDTVSFNHTDVETLSLSLANSSVTAFNPLVCDDSSGTSCDIAFSDAAFRFLYGSSNSTTLPNQVSGSEFGDTLKIQAVKASNGVCVGLFSGNKDIDLSQENIDPGGTSGLNFSIDTPHITIAKKENVPSQTTITLNFDANSIATIPTPIYHDAGKIRLHANYDIDGVTLSGSSNNSFWVSPAKLVAKAYSNAISLDGALATSTTTYAAGEDFSLSVSALNSLDVITPNYSPGQIHLILDRTGPTLAVSVDGNLTYTASSSLATGSNQDVSLTNFISGVSTYDMARYSEVGLINLTVQDNDYGNLGIFIPSTAISIGRFIPDYFTQTVAEDGSFMATCNIGATFAYSGQKDEATSSVGAISYLTNPVLEITARNKQGDITQNYYEDSQGSVNDYMKLSNTGVDVTKPTEDETTKGIDGNYLPLTANLNTGVLTTGDLSQNDLTTTIPANNPLPKGVLHYQLLDDYFFYNRSANALVTPFTSEIDFAIDTIIDEDLVDLIPTNPLISPTTANASPTGVEIRFGRLVLENSFGPETSNLPQPMQIQHFDGTDFIHSLDDNCSSYDASKIVLTNTNTNNSLNLALTSKQGGAGNFVAGKTREIKLEAPGAGNQGEIGVSYDSYDWLKFDWDNDGAHDDNPSAIATFGLFRGNDRIIYSREVFN